MEYDHDLNFEPYLTECDVNSNEITDQYRDIATDQYRLQPTAYSLQPISYCWGRGGVGEEVRECM